MSTVQLSRLAEKQLSKVPKRIIESLWYWVATVERIGVRETRKLKGYHDEPLKGERKGQRSIRLNRSYRAIYIETKTELEILIIEVNQHEY